MVGPIVSLPLSAEVEASAELPFLGAICAGAASRLVGTVARTSLARAIRDELDSMGEGVVERNVDCALAAYDALEEHAGVVSEGDGVSAEHFAPPEWVDLPLEAAHLAAPDILATVTSVQIKTGAWRTIRPVIDPAICNKCTWVCSTVCPDSAIRVTAEGRPDIDYDHCKGCLICVAVCPPHAISAVPETAPGDPS